MWWNRELVTRRDVVLTTSPVSLFSDPAACEDAALADEMRTFVALEHASGPVRVEVYRWGGATPDAMVRLEAAPVEVLTSERVARVEWPVLPAATRTELVAAALAGTVTATVRVLHTCRRNS